MFSDLVVNFYQGIQNWNDLPKDFESIFPFRQADTQRAMKAFYRKYYSDQQERVFLYGINPGRFGAGITGISFTDPFFLENVCAIPNDWPKRKELSSEFIYGVIDQWGGPSSFYRHFYLTSICPIGFLKNGKNANYYDDQALQAHVETKIIQWMWTQIGFGARRDIAYSIGRGKNLTALQELNDKHGFFDKIEPLPHPRWVMQYRRKKMNTFVDEYCQRLAKTLII